MDDLVVERKRLPSFDESIFDGAYDYGQLLESRFPFSRDAPESRPDISDLKDAVRADKVLFEYFAGGAFYEINTWFLIKYSIDRFVHLNNRYEASDDEIFELYSPLECWFSRPVLDLKIVIPILAVQFADESYRVTDGIKLIKLSEALQLARAPESSFSYGHHPLVQSVATHAFMLENYQIENPSCFAQRNLLSAEVADTVNLLFACLRLTAHLETGYAQVLAIPIGWARAYKGDRIRILSESVKVYPSQLENGSWGIEEPRILASHDLSLCSKLFTLLREISSRHKRMEVALRRFNNSYLRQNEEDTLLDVLIALECLLSDSGTGEMTYKLSLRVAALSVLSAECVLPANEVCREVKKVYDLRSAIVHGSPDRAMKAANIDRLGTLVPTVQVATEHLRTVIVVLANNPDYLDPAKIDSLVLDQLAGHLGADGRFG